MSDTDSPGGGPNGGPGGDQPAAGQAPPPLQIHAQYLKDLSFESPNAAKLMALRQAPQISVQVDVRANPVDGGQRTEVVLHLRCDASVQDTQAFIIEADYAALVSLSADLPRERRAAALMVDVPNMIFPFARAVVADASRDGGFPPLLIQPIDFVAMFRRQIQALRERMGNEAGGDGATGSATGGDDPAGTPPGTTPGTGTA